MLPTQESNGFLYRELAQQLTDAMRVGSLRLGDRVPSVRRLSQQYAVSISTAVQALRLLESQRLIEARPKSGFYVSRRPHELAEPESSRPPQSARYVVSPSLVREYLEAMASPDIVSASAVLPQASLFPVRRLARSLAAVVRRDPSMAANYEAFSTGAQELRRVIARRAIDHGLRIDADEVIVTNGCIEAITLALRAVAKPGDTIALESPTHFQALQAIEGLGMKALEIPTHPRTGISIEALDLATHKPGAVRALSLVPTYSNPLGSCMPHDQRKRLVELCAERDIPIVENDVVGELTFDTARPRPLKAWDRSGNVLLCSSFSKTLAPGLRVGWILPGRYQREVELLKMTGPMFTPRPTQLAVADFLNSGGYDVHLRKLRGALRDQAAQMREAIAASFPSDARVTRPNGGLVLWVELPAAVDGVELFRRARAQNIVVAPGPLYTSTGRFRNCLRISFSRAMTRSLEDAMACVGRLVREML